MIFRIYPTKDTTITNDYLRFTRTRATGSNLGGSEELEVFKAAGVSGVIGDASSSSLGRVLMQFDLGLFSSLTASGIIPTSGSKYFLRMNHKSMWGPQPTSFDMLVRPISSSWDEGVGRDVVGLLDLGFANWVKPTSTSFWNSPGGDLLSSPTASFHFDTGFENLEADVTAIVSSWLSGSIPNNGISVSLTPQVESDSLYVDYCRKKFYSRQTDFLDRGPYIEVRSDDSLRDDRVNMQWSRTGSLWLYNIVGGQRADLAVGPISVTIADRSGTLLSLTASHRQTGLYSVSFALPTGSYSGSVFTDSWGSGSFALMTGSFSFVDAGPVPGVSQLPLSARVRDLQDEYSVDDVVSFEVLFRRKSHSVPVLQTASLAAVPYIVERAYYAIENDATRERVIPFGTGSDHTRLSYGQDGNSFQFFMSNLHRGNVYRILFLAFDQGRQQVIDQGIRFKVI